MKKEKAFWGYIEGWLSIIINTLLFILKYWAGIVTGSVAIIADAWHTLSDSLTSIVVIIGFKMSEKPADKEHPFGHGRAELISALIIGVLLAIVGFNFIVESIDKLKHHESSFFKLFAVIIFLVSVLFKEGLAQFSFWAGKKTNSMALKADGWHHRSDALASALILAGLFLGKFFWWIDGVLGIIVALLIIHSSWSILMSAINPLMGETPDKETLEKVRKIACTEANLDINLHHIHMHRYGDHFELTFHIKMKGDTKLHDAHKVATHIEKAIRKKLRMETTIHVEPSN